MPPVISLACRRATGAPRANGVGILGVPASERVGGTAGAKPPGSKLDEKILDAAKDFFGM
jgi:hypothetical protein